MLDIQPDFYPRSILYCAHCKKNYGLAKREMLGHYFICPNQKSEDSNHLARVIRDNEAAICWLVREGQLYNYRTKWSQLVLLQKIWSKSTIPQKIRPMIEAGPFLFISTIILGN